MRKKISAFTICLLIIMALFAAFDMTFELTPTARASVIYVGGSGQGNLSTIQEGVDAAIDGDTVFVFNGTYNEVVDISKSINLIGENKDGTIINGGENYTINVSFANSLRIEKFWIKGKNGSKGHNGGEGLVIENSTVNLANLKVKGGMGGEVIELKNRYFEGGNGLRCYNSTLTINNSIIYGGDGIKGLDNVGWDIDANDDGNGGKGSEALISMSSEISINNCKLLGGNGGNGGYGGDGGDTCRDDGKKGGDGGDADNGVRLDSSNFTVFNTSIVGGNGGKGGNGGISYPPGAVNYGGFGGNGGNGGMALFSKHSNLSIEGTDICGGSGGTGGKGGFGDRSGNGGGDGGNGGGGIWSLDTIIVYSNGTAKSGNGGLGAKGGGHSGSGGGSGGGGGNGGNCLFGNQSKIVLFNVTITTGAGGDGGDNGSNWNGGDGGNGGNGGTGLCMEYSNLNLEKIKIITGDGGFGGIGGNTTGKYYMGSNPVGGDGGNGGNGGDSIVVFYSSLTAIDIEAGSGNGKNGSYGGYAGDNEGGYGGTGGNGGSTIVSVGSKLFIMNANMTAGNAGDGEHGGDADLNGRGGDGGKGGNGGSIFLNTSAATLLSSNFTAGNAGNGNDGGNGGGRCPSGNGGNGGDGGFGGDGIYAVNSNVTIENTALTCGYGGFLGTKGLGTSPGRPGSDGRDGTIYINKSNIIFLNSSITGGDSDEPIIWDDICSIEFKWYLHIKVVNLAGFPVGNAEIIVKDNANGTFEEVYSTDSDGYARWIIVTEYIESLSGRTYYTPHNVMTTFDGNVSYVVPEPWVNQSMEVVSILSELKDYILLDKGWNLISIQKIQPNTSIQAVLQSIEGQYDAVQWYNAANDTDCWQHYRVSKPPYMNDLKDIDHTMGFWIHITTTGGTTLVVNGTHPLSPHCISLHKGWNLVGYPSLANKYRTTALNNLTFGTHVDSIWTYNAVTQKWKEIDESDYFEVGKGYWIHAKTNCVWEVPL